MIVVFQRYNNNSKRYTSLCIPENIQESYLESSMLLGQSSARARGIVYGTLEIKITTMEYSETLTI